MEEVEKNKFLESKKNDFHTHLIYEDKAKFMESLIPTNNFDGALHSEWIALADLDRKDAEEVLTQAIVYINKHLCVKFPADNVEAAKTLILADYGHLYPDDVMLCVRMGLTGKLTPFYGRIDAQVVYNWFYEYNIQRATAIRIMEARREAAEWRRREAQDAQ